MATAAEMIADYRRAKSALEGHARTCERCRQTFNCPTWSDLNDAQHNAGVTLVQNGMSIPDA